MCLVGSQSYYSTKLQKTDSGRPTPWAPRYLQNEGHMATIYLWWPGLDGEVEKMIQNCGVCQAMQKVPAVVPLHPVLQCCARVWQRLHLDFAEKDKQSFLVVVDSYSKWLEVFHMTSTTSSRTTDMLHLFALYGLPEEVVSDNGSQFVSSEFKQFLTRNGIKQTLVPAYDRASKWSSRKVCADLEKSTCEAGP